MKNKVNSFLWEVNFPPIYGHTSISFLKNCPGFNEAKQGDTKAASSVVSLCIKQHRINALRLKYPNAILLPVITKNQLPIAFAKAIGLKTYTGIMEIDPLSRKKMSSMERLIHKPSFTGKVIKEQHYIIVDDVVAQGGTVSALRNHVINCGGYVCAVTALAYSTDTSSLAPNPNNILMLIKKFEYMEITNILNDYHIANNLWELTNPQVKYLLRFKELKRINKKLTNTYVMLNEKIAANT